MKQLWGRVLCGMVAVLILGGAAQAGGSSLMALPVEDVELDDYQKLTELLLTVPDHISEISASAVRDGRTDWAVE